MSLDGSKAQPGDNPLLDHLENIRTGCSNVNREARKDAQALEKVGIGQKGADGSRAWAAILEEGSKLDSPDHLKPKDRELG